MNERTKNYFSEELWRIQRQVTLIKDWRTHIKGTNKNRLDVIQGIAKDLTKRL